MFALPQRSHDMEGSKNCTFAETGAFDRDDDGLFRLSDRAGTSGEDEDGAVCSVVVELW